MKKLLLTILLLTGFIAYGQQPALKRDSLMAKAHVMLIPGHKLYNPTAAFIIYQKKALDGNPEAMNALGLLYTKGTGVAINEKRGFIWIEKAAKNGYIEAWHNLGLLYKEGTGVPKLPNIALNCFIRASRGGYTHSWDIWGTMVKDGEGTPQNYELAFNIFKKGAQRGIASCLYSQGYMYYKGLGCTQDYEMASDLFKKGARKGSPGSMYMLGLSYRNGYGVEINVDSARYWLTKVAKLGDKRAKDELESAEAENINPTAQKTTKRTANKSEQPAPGKLPKEYAKVKQQIRKDDLDGEYNGYLIRYDWSGQNVISKSRLKLRLTKKDSVFTGEWNEKDVQTTFQAHITDSALVFFDSKLSRTDHYHPNIPIEYLFKNAKLQLVTTKDSIYLAGNLELYSTKSREPEKPMYISLVRKEKTKPSNPEKKATAIGNTSAFEALIELNTPITEFVAYPNPFEKSFTVSFNLEREETIKARITDMMGRIIFQQIWTKQPAGIFSHNLSVNAPAGGYILHLTYGDQSKTTVLIKQ